jgi:hypothetical protein
MDIKDLDKKQLILLTLLITFVVSIATGIVTVSLMNQMPKTVPQTINNVIQRTIEKVTTVETPTKTNVAPSNNENGGTILGSGDIVVNIYSITDNTLPTPPTLTTPPTTSESPSIPSSNGTITTTPTPTLVSQKELGQGIIISDVGLILVESSILTDSQIYKIILNKTDFDATVLKKFSNGFTILKITEKKTAIKTSEETKNPVSSSTTNN